MAVDDELLRDSLQELYEQAPCGYIFMRPDGTLTRVNSTFVELTGYKREELQQSTRFQHLLTTASKIFYENQFAPLICLQGSVKEVTFDLVHKSGERIPILVNAVQRADGQDRPIEIACTIFAATERRTYERELLLARRRAEQMAAVISASNDAVLSVATDGRVQTWNPAAERLFGLPRGALDGRVVAELIASLGHPEEWQRVLSELCAGRPVQVETLGAHSGGGLIDLSVSLAAQIGLLGEVTAVSLIVRDIGERRALERQKDEFLATMSHDLKNPVAGIKGWTQLLMRRTRRLPESERERWQTDLATIDATTSRLAGMIDELLDLTHGGMGRPLELHLQTADLVALVRRVAAENQQLTDRHSILVRTASDSLEGRWDRARLERIIGNLVSNAVKYSPEGGEVTVTVTRETRPAGDFAIITVADRGLGIPLEDQARVFDRFFRGATVADWIPGSGIGLARRQAARGAARGHDRSGQRSR